MSTPVTESDPSGTRKDPERLSRDQMTAVKDEIRVSFERGGGEGMSTAGLLEARATLALRNTMDAHEVIEFFLGCEGPGNRTDPDHPAMRMNEKRKGLRCWQEALRREVLRHDKWSPELAEREKHALGMEACKNLTTGVDQVIETTQTGVGHPDRAAARALNMRLFLQSAWSQIRAGRDEFPDHYRAALPGADEKAVAWAGWMAHDGDGEAIMDLHTVMMAQHERDPEDTLILPRMQDVGRSLLRCGRGEAVAFMNSIDQLTDKFNAPELGRAVHVFDVISNAPKSLESSVREDVVEFLLKNGLTVMAAARGGKNDKLVLRSLVRVSWTLDEDDRAIGLGGRLLLEDARMKPFLTAAFHFLVDKSKISAADVLAAHIDSDDVLQACLKNKTLQKKKNSAPVWNRNRLANAAGGTGTKEESTTRSAARIL